MIIRIINMKRKATTTKRPVLKRQKTTMLIVPTRRRQQKSMIIPDELKYNDVSISTDASTTETVVALTTFAAGDTALLRDGNKIVCKSIELRINMANEAVTQSNTVRFVLVKCMQCNATAPTWYQGGVLTDVFDASTVTARRAIISASRYRILMDETIVVNQMTGVAASAPTQAYFHKYLKLSQDVTQFFDGTAAVPMTNAYYLMYVGSTASGVTDLDIAGTARLRFVG